MRRWPSRTSAGINDGRRRRRPSGMHRRLSRSRRTRTARSRAGAASSAMSRRCWLNRQLAPMLADSRMPLERRLGVVRTHARCLADGAEPGEAAGRKGPCRSMHAPSRMRSTAWPMSAEGIAHATRHHGRRAHAGAAARRSQRSSSTSLGKACSGDERRRSRQSSAASSSRSATD